MPVKTLDTLQPVFGLTAFVILVVSLALGKATIALPILLLMLVKILIDLSFHLWSLRIYARWTRAEPKYYALGPRAPSPFLPEPFYSFSADPPRRRELGLAQFFAAAMRKMEIGDTKGCEPATSLAAGPLKGQCRRKGLEPTRSCDHWIFESSAWPGPVHATPARRRTEDYDLRLFAQVTAVAHKNGTKLVPPICALASWEHFLKPTAWLSADGGTWRDECRLVPLLTSAHFGSRTAQMPNKFTLARAPWPETSPLIDSVHAITYKRS